MTYQRKKRFLPILLTLVMLLELLPLNVFAAFRAPGSDIASIVAYKGMTMSVMTSGSQISRYENLSAENTFYQGFNLNNEDTWVKLAYTIEKSQPVSLKLYRLKPSAVEEGDGEQYGHAELKYFYDLAMPDYGADTPEEFLDGDLIGYINGVHILDNIENPDESAPKVEPHPLSDDDWLEIIYNTHYNKYQKKPIIDEYSYGFQGEKLEVEPEEVSTELDSAEDDEQNEVPATPEDSEPSDNETILDTPTEPDKTPEDIEGAEALPVPDEDVDTGDEPANDPSEEDDGTKKETVSDTLEPSDDDGADAEEVQPDDSAAVEDKEDAASPEDLAPDALEPSDGDTDDSEEAQPDTSAVVEDKEDAADPEAPAHPEEPEAIPERVQLLGAESVLGSSVMAVASQEDALIQNYILWDGSLVDESGAPIEYTYEDGYYVIVLEPTTPGTKVYNSFLGFQVDTTIIPENLASYLAHDEIQERLQKLAESRDPVKLITGS